MANTRTMLVRVFLLSSWERGMKSFTVLWYINIVVEERC